QPRQEAAKLEIASVSALFRRSPGHHARPERVLDPLARRKPAQPGRRPEDAAPRRVVARIAVVRVDVPPVNADGRRTWEPMNLGDRRARSVDVLYRCSGREPRDDLIEESAPRFV